MKLKLYFWLSIIYFCFFLNCQTATGDVLTLSPDPTPSFPKKERATTRYYPIPLENKLQDIVFLLSEEYDVPAELIFAVIETESGFDAEAIGETDDYGLMQINGIHCEWLKEDLGITDLLDPEQNLKAGIYILAEHLKETGEINLALMAYNYGLYGARELWSEGIWSTLYSRTVMQRIAKYERGDWGD